MPSTLHGRKIFSLSLIVCSALAAPLAGQSQADSSKLTVTTLNIAANSLAWDPRSQQIYLTVPGSNRAQGSIQVLNPVTAAIGTSVSVSSAPDLIAVSPNSKYVYVGLDSTSSVQRFTLPGFSPDVQIPLGTDPTYGPLYASDLRPSPAADGTVAVVTGAVSHNPPQQGGAVIYDDATRRAVLCQQPGVCGVSGAVTSIQWNAAATEMFAAGSDGLYVVPVSATGFGKLTNVYDVLTDIGNAIHFDANSGYVFADSGQIADPVAQKLVGTFGGSGVYDSIAMVPDAALGKAFFISGAEFTGNTYTLQSYDMRTLQLIDTVMIPNVVGVPTHFIRWGTNGLAFTTASASYSPGSAVYILSGSFVSPAADPPAITAGAVTPLYSSSTTVQPGEWISIFGSVLAPQTATWTGNFPTSLGNTSVTIDGRQAYLWYVSPGQINLQVPDDPANGSVPVVVTTPNGSATTSVTLGPSSPSLLLLDSTHTCAIILRSDGSGAYGGGTYDIVGPTGNSLGYPTVAAKAGDTIAIFAVGLGPTTPGEFAGQAFSGAASTTNPVTVTINNQNLTPSFAGLSSAGLYQVNLAIPASLGVGDAPITLSVGGIRTSAGKVISLQ